MSLFQEIIWAFNNGKVGIIVALSIIGFVSILLALFFFLMRESVVWYLRIHELIALQKKTNDMLALLIADKGPDRPKPVIPTIERVQQPQDMELPHAKILRRMEEAEVGKIVPLDTI